MAESILNFRPIWNRIEVYCDRLAASWVEVVTCSPAFAQFGSRCRTGTAGRGVPIPERKVDLEKLARRSSPVSSTTQPTTLDA